MVSRFDDPSAPADAAVYVAKRFGRNQIHMAPSLAARARHFPAAAAVAAENSQVRSGDK
jgi:hypothetical protein